MVTAEGEKAYVSYYETEDALIAVAADFAYGTSEIKLFVPKDSCMVKNLLTGEEYRVENGQATIVSDMATLNLLLIK